MMCLLVALTPGPEVIARIELRDPLYSLMRHEGATSQP